MYLDEALIHANSYQKSVKKSGGLAHWYLTFGVGSCYTAQC